MGARGRVVAMIAGAAVVTMPAPHDAASASCVGPMLETRDAAPPTITPGQRLTVVGRFFLDGCNDTRVVVRSYGCSTHEQAPEVVRPLDDVTLSLQQGGHTWRLGTADANSAGRVRWVVTLPVDLEPGRATLVTDQSRGLRVVVRR